mgnify:CR=1 FL=1
MLIVTHHKSTQTVAKHAADSDIENYVDAGFEKVMDEFNVDLYWEDMIMYIPEVMFKRRTAQFRAPGYD